MSYQDISDIENGDRQPRLEEILVLARKLGVRVRYLETGKGLVALGPQELGHIHDFLGDSESRKRRRLAKYHNGH
ncbi:MAG: helix-turn-helix domain-containing protein [Candidatus Saccharimonadales bacterium]